MCNINQMQYQSNAMPIYDYFERPSVKRRLPEDTGRRLQSVVVLYCIFWYIVIVVRSFKFDAQCGPHWQSRGKWYMLYISLLTCAACTAVYFFSYIYTTTYIIVLKVLYIVEGWIEAHVFEGVRARVWEWAARKCFFFFARTTAHVHRRENGYFLSARC